MACSLINMNDPICQFFISFQGSKNVPHITSSNLTLFDALMSIIINKLKILRDRELESLFFDLSILGNPLSHTMENSGKTRTIFESFIVHGKDCSYLSQLKQCFQDSSMYL